MVLRGTLDRLRNRFRREILGRRVAAAKAARAAQPYSYVEYPNLSLILLSFNHRINIKQIVARLRRTKAEELIVCDDGSIDGSERVWLRHLTRPNDFLVRSNDIHEIRSYNRAIDLARGEFVCVMQDDDIPPDDGQWVDDALDLFQRYPALAVLGCYEGGTYTYATEGKKRRGPRFGSLPSDRGIIEIPLTEPFLGKPFMFVQNVNIGPLFFRREAFRSLGGFDTGFSGPGESGHYLDNEICMKAWSTGHQVGLFEAVGFRRHVGGRGTLIFGAAARQRNKDANIVRLRRTYADKVIAVDQLIEDLNQGLAPRRSPL